MRKFLCVAISAAISCVMLVTPVFAEAVTNELPGEVDARYYEMPDPSEISIEEAAPGATIIYDLPYCGDNSTSYQKLHLVLPSDKKADKVPVLVFVHGGAWSRNNSTEDHMVTATARAALCTVDAGYAVALVDYSVKNKENEYALPNQIYEIKAAVRFLRSVADEYGLDADKIALIGESAGGHLVDIVGTTNGDEEYDKEEYGYIDYSSDVQAVIGQYSICNLEGQPDPMVKRLFGVDPAAVTEEELQEKYEYVSAIYHVDENDPPFYLEHGTADTTVPYTQSEDFYAALTDAGVENCELHIYPDMEHAVAWFQSDYVCEGIIDWLNRVLEY